MADDGELSGHTVTVLTDGEKDAAPDCFTIETDFPPGQYYRRR